MCKYLLVKKKKKLRGGNFQNRIHKQKKNLENILKKKIQKTSSSPTLAINIVQRAKNPTHAL